MLREVDTFTPETSEKFGLASFNFSIKDPTLIFDAVTDKMYSTPIQTMVQEYMCNARDAHREVGKFDTPIEITLPTRINKYLVIKDKGPGLTEKRIREVFVFLGESTKTDSNLQTGGWGLGAKIAWAYTDSFTVISTVNGAKSTYLAYKGEAGIRKFDLLESVTTDETNGVAIQIRIKNKDVHEVERAVNRMCFFWDVQPVVYNRQKNFTPYKGKAQHAKLVEYPYTLNKRPLCVVDGVPYTLDTSVPGLRSFTNVHRMCPCLFFKTGEIDVAVNRESIRYSDKTIRAINSLIARVETDSIKAEFELLCSVYDVDSLLDGAKKFMSNFGFLGIRSIKICEDVVLKLSTAATWLQFAVPVTHVTLTYDNSLVSKVRATTIKQRNYHSHAVHDISPNLYIYNGSGAPPKNKAIPLFTNTNPHIDVLCVPDKAVYDQLLYLGLNDYNTLKEVQEEVVPVKRAHVTGIRQLLISKRITSVDITDTCFYVHYKERKQYFDLLKNSSVNAQIVVPTVAQLPELLDMGVQHVTVFLKQMYADYSSHVYSSLSKACNHSIIDNSVLHMRQHEYTVLCVYIRSFGLSSLDPLFAQYVSCVFDHAFLVSDSANEPRVLKTIGALLYPNKKRRICMRRDKEAHLLQQKVESLYNEIKNKYYLLPLLIDSCRFSGYTYTFDIGRYEKTRYVNEVRKYIKCVNSCL